MEHVFFDSFMESVEVVSIVFLLMIGIELLVLKYKKQIHQLSQTNSIFKYVFTSFTGLFLGCTGTYAVGSLYMAGLMSFGGVVAVLIATMGDEVTLAALSMVIKGDLSSVSFLVLMASTLLLGIVGGWFADVVAKRFSISFASKCTIEHHEHEVEFTWKHFLKEHIYVHIVKKHLWQIFLWVFAAFFIVHVFIDGHDANPFDVDAYSGLFLLLVAAVAGLLPIAGPNIAFVVLFASGGIPFSILLTNALVQDGHGILPILGFSPSDAIKIKLYKVLFGLLVGVSLFYMGF